MTSHKLAANPPGSLAFLTLQTQPPANVVGITRLMSGLASVLFDFKVWNISSFGFSNIIRTCLSCSPSVAFVLTVEHQK